MAIDVKEFGVLPDGRKVSAYTLSGAGGTSVTISDYGCRILSLMVKDRDGKLGDMVLGHKSLQEYLGKNYLPARGPRRVSPGALGRAATGRGRAVHMLYPAQPRRGRGLPRQYYRPGDLSAHGGGRAVHYL